ncbi:MAG: radical SAM protein [Alistipes sp.]|nr:radical SAM protein [Alistipes sp.]
MKQEVTEIKKEQMKELAAYKRTLWKSPRLRNLFLELTLRCNENCIHCGSRCGEVESGELTLEQYQNFLEQVKKDFGTEEIMLCVTGGEPLLRRDFFEIMSYADRLGFHWGMTSNGVLIDEAVAERLKKCGMQTISVSIDGLRKTHDTFRRTPGGYDAAMRGLNALIAQGGFQHIQVTTVVHQNNIGELEQLFQVLDGMDIASWRIMNLEPIGRAQDFPELFLHKQDYIHLFHFIQEKRKQGIPVLYGCSHYLGPEYERELRDWYFLCNAGIYTAGIMANGDIGACLDIERKPELIYGNILKDDFKEIWEHGFGEYRRNRCEDNETCQKCPEQEFCGGGSFHSWDFKEKKQKVCFKGTLF